MKILINNFTMIINVLLAIFNAFMARKTSLRIEKEKHRHEHDLQTESFFKQKGIEEQRKIFSEWTNFMTNMDETTMKYSSSNPEGLEKLKKLIHDTFMYGSKRTDTLLALYSSNIYLKSDPSYSKNISKEKEFFDQQKDVVYFAFIIASLKYDFTDVVIDPLLILKIEIKDYYSYESMYKKCALQIENEINNFGN